ncbi:MAG: OsmC family protein [Gammaproteobacteria bacterium]|nr:OsmC family protein [Gammaproteobacteria bacterium]
MKARIRSLQGVSFEAESGSGHRVIIDGAPEHGGENRGVRPMELLLMGLGGCTAFDVVLILRRGRHVVSRCEVDVDAERADTEPKVFTRIRLQYRVHGTGLTEKAVRRAIDLSAKKYCSATIMLAKTAVIEHAFEIIADE